MFHDYETWGVNPKYDFACQFAAIRTDLSLNTIGKPTSFFCQIPNDYLPNPHACLVTGITPQQSLRDGMIEAQFAQKVNACMSQPETCVVGYNSIRFDDEVSRHLFYRNFIDPYEREYKNGNSRWDIIDLVRACYALRPDGINWPIKESGVPSFKLEELTAANNIQHEAAHDAVSDVKATIAFTKLVQTAQPKLFDYFFTLRNKHNVNDLICYDGNSPLVYVSGIVSPANGCTTLILPICPHPSNSNAVICVDLNTDCSVFDKLESEQLSALLYKSADNYEPGESRPGIKVIHVNKSPFLATAKTLTDDISARISIDLNYCRMNLKAIKNSKNVRDKLLDVFSSTFEQKKPDIDAALYTREFPSSADKQWLKQVLHAQPEQLIKYNDSAPNEDFRAQLFRYRARNYPHTLTESEAQRWHRHRHSRFNDNNKQTCLSAAEFHAVLTELAQQHSQNKTKLRIISTLEQYLNGL